MESNFQEQLLTIMQNCLRPIARMMLRSGVGYREFSAICKQAFVDIASSDYGLRGRPTNISRVAIMTGLTRKEVKKIRDRLKNDAGPKIVKSNPAAHVLHFWYLDPDYCDQEGIPLELPFGGEAPSFISLVRKYGGDIPPVALLKELKRANAVESVQKDYLRVLKRHFVPFGPDKRLLLSLQNQLLAHLCTIDNNNKPEFVQDPESGFFDRLVYSEGLKKSARPRFRRMSKEHAMEFLNVLDDWISANEDSSEGAINNPGPTTGMGVFYYEGHDEPN